MTTRPVLATSVLPREPLGVLQFDMFRLFPRRRQLMRHQDEVHIGARAFDLLVELASRAGEIVSSAELMDAAWPNLVVCDCNLKTQISTLQRILGESPTGGRYIKCVALRGYMFVGDVFPTASLASGPPGIAGGREWEQDPSGAARLVALAEAAE